VKAEAKESQSPGRKARMWRIARLILLLVVAFLAARVIIGIVGAIDWSAVWTAIGLLTVPAVVLLLLALACRQMFNAIPLTRFVPGLSLARSVQNDVTAFLMGTVAPPPSDVVLRVSMFRLPPSRSGGDPLWRARIGWRRVSAPTLRGGRSTL
jgi:hypothetical protein